MGSEEEEDQGTTRPQDVPVVGIQALKYLCNETTSTSLCTFTARSHGCSVMFLGGEGAHQAENCVTCCHPLSFPPLFSHVPEMKAAYLCEPAGREKTFSIRIMDLGNSPRCSKLELSR